MYAGLKTFLRADVTLYIQVVVPVIMFLTYLLILGKPGSIVPEEVEGQSSGGGGKEIVNEEDNDKHSKYTLTHSPHFTHPHRRTGHSTIRGPSPSLSIATATVSRTEQG